MRLLINEKHHKPVYFKPTYTATQPPKKTGHQDTRVSKTVYAVQCSEVFIPAQYMQHFWTIISCVPSSEAQRTLVSGQ